MGHLTIKTIELWVGLFTILDCMRLPWVVLSHFNTYLTSSNKVGGVEPNLHSIVYNALNIVNF